ARLLARRTLRALDELGNDLTLIDVLTVQLDAMAMDFPEYAEKGEGIFKIAELEESRYRQVLTRGKEILTRYTATAKARNETRLSSETLMELYDSHGLPPDFVKQTLQPMNVQVDFPEDFFAQIAKRHEKPAPAVHEETRTDALKARLSHLPPTRKLFYEDQYMREFDATVLDVDSRLLILDQTAFYAEGGGQLADTGVVRHEKGECRVVNVQSVNNVIVHFIEGQPPEKGWRVRGVLDWTRRRALMRHHTATHVLMGAAVKVLGDHVWQAGAQKDVDKARLDITHYDKLTTEQLQQIETLANDAVMAELPVEIQLFPRSEAEAKFGFRLYQGGVIPDRELRVIHIGGWDVEACAGTHCKSTGEIGFIKIIRGERIQDGVERLHFAAGLPAVEYSQSETERLKILSEILETPRETLEKSAETLKQDLKTLRKKLESLEHTLADYYTSQLIDSAVTVGPVKVVKSVMEGEEAAFLITLGGKMIESDPRLVVALVTRTEKAANVVVMAGNEAVRHGVHAGKIVSEIAKAMNGKGGGKPYLGQGGSSNTAKAEDALKTIEEHIRSMVKAKRHDR
ncbi:MAG: alanine--tRNA ligase-related protein, partial [Candidatus Bathyarchaeia archaeon]